MGSMRPRPVARCRNVFLALLIHKSKYATRRFPKDQSQAALHACQQPRLLRQPNTEGRGSRFNPGLKSGAAARRSVQAIVGLPRR